MSVRAANDASFDRLATFQALVTAAHEAARGHRRSTEVRRFFFDLEPEILAIERELVAGEYAPRGFRTFTITQPKPRTISAAPFRDRVVHHALCRELEPGFERYAVRQSFACRVGYGSHASVRYLRELVGQHSDGYSLSLDIEHYFETLPHESLIAHLRRRVRDRRIVELATTFVRQGAPGSPPGRGLPIGNLTSQHFANFYLSALDHRITRGLRVPGYVRYMDDMRLFAPSPEPLRRALAEVEHFVGATLGLTLKASETRLSPVRDGVAFLGFRVFPGTVRLDGRRRRRFIRKMRSLREAIDRGLMSEDDAVAAAQSMIGWVAHANTHRMRQRVLADGAPNRIGDRGRGLQPGQPRR